MNLIQESDEGSLKAIILAVFEQHPDEVARFKGGENQLTGFFMGQVMKASGGKADPKTSNQLLRQLIQEI
jgi:aspartyl-tRNA(Asn)/glutamyl-tRNA(Gln) amidotransferase subunit B